MKKTHMFNIMLLTPLLLSGCTSTVMTTSYVDYAAAEADGAVERGWIPSFLPSSATRIEETHDLDTNQQCLRAIIPQADVKTTIDSLTDEGFSPFTGELAEPPRLSILGGCPFSLKDVPDENQVFINQGSLDQYVVVDPHEGQLFFWTVLD